MDVVVDNDPPGLTRDPGAAKRFFAHHNKTGEMQFVQVCTCQANCESVITSCPA